MGFFGKILEKLGIKKEAVLCIYFNSNFSSCWCDCRIYACTPCREN